MKPREFRKSQLFTELSKCVHDSRKDEDSHLIWIHKIKQLEWIIKRIAQKQPDVLVQSVIARLDRGHPNTTAESTFKALVYCYDYIPQKRFAEVVIAPLIKIIKEYDKGFIFGRTAIGEPFYTKGFLRKEAIGALAQIPRHVVDQPLRDIVALLMTIAQSNDYENVRAAAMIALSQLAYRIEENQLLDVIDFVLYDIDKLKRNQELRSAAFKLSQHLSLHMPNDYLVIMKDKMINIACWDKHEEAIDVLCVLFLPLANNIDGFDPIDFIIEFFGELNSDYKLKYFINNLEEISHRIEDKQWMRLFRWLIEKVQSESWQTQAIQILRNLNEPLEKEQFGDVIAFLMNTLEQGNPEVIREQALCTLLYFFEKIPGKIKLDLIYLLIEGAQKDDSSFMRKCMVIGIGKLCDHHSIGTDQHKDMLNVLLEILAHENDMQACKRVVGILEKHVDTLLEEQFKIMINLLISKTPNYNVPVYNGIHILINSRSRLTSVQLKWLIITFINNRLAFTKQERNNKVTYYTFNELFGGFSQDQFEPAFEELLEKIKDDYNNLGNEYFLWRKYRILVRFYNEVRAHDNKAIICTLLDKLEPNANADVCERVLWALSNLTHLTIEKLPARFIQLLLNFAKQSTSPTIRGRAISLIGKLASHILRTELTSAIKVTANRACYYNEPWIRANACYSLGQLAAHISTAEQLDIFIPVLLEDIQHDKNSSARENALWALSQLPQQLLCLKQYKKIISVLEESAESDQCTEVQAQARKTLAFMESERKTVNDKEVQSQQYSLYEILAETSVSETDTPKPISVISKHDTEIDISACSADEKESTSPPILTNTPQPAQSSEPTQPLPITSTQPTPAIVPQTSHTPVPPAQSTDLQQTESPNKAQSQSLPLTQASTERNASVTSAPEPTSIVTESLDNLDALAGSADEKESSPPPTLTELPEGTQTTESIRPPASAPLQPGPKMNCNHDAEVKETEKEYDPSEVQSGCYNEAMVMRIWTRYAEHPVRRLHYYLGREGEGEKEHDRSIECHLFKSNMMLKKDNALLVNREGRLCRLYQTKNFMGHKTSLSLCSMVNHRALARGNIGTNHIEEALKQFSQWKKHYGCARYHTILFAYHSRDDHWCLGQLELEFHEGQLQPNGIIHIYDPMGSLSLKYQKTTSQAQREEASPEAQQTITQAINEEFQPAQRFQLHCQPAQLFQGTFVRQQPKYNGNACGVLVAENGKDMIDGVIDRIKKRIYSEDKMTELRLEHLNQAQDKRFKRLQSNDAYVNEPSSDTEPPKAPFKIVCSTLKDALAQCDSVVRGNITTAFRLVHQAIEKGQKESITDERFSVLKDTLVHYKDKLSQILPERQCTLFNVFFTAGESHGYKYEGGARDLLKQIAEEISPSEVSQYQRFSDQFSAYLKTFGLLKGVLFAPLDNGLELTSDSQHPLQRIHQVLAEETAHDQAALGPYIQQVRKQGVQQVKGCSAETAIVNMRKDILEAEISIDQSQHPRLYRYIISVRAINVLEQVLERYLLAVSPERGEQSPSVSQFPGSFIRSWPQARSDGPQHDSRQECSLM